MSRILFLGLSFIATAICAWAAAAHYRKLAWGDPWQPIGWLLSMFFLLCAFARLTWLGDRLQIFNKAKNSILSFLDPVIDAESTLKPNGSISVEE